LKMTEEDYDAVVAVHQKGSFNCARHAAPLMKEAGYGRIINITSSAGLRGNFGQSNYGAAKAALMGMTFVWAVELGKYGITVNAMAPAGFTRMTEGLYQGAEPPPDQNPALNAPLVAFLASEQASYVNGQVLGRTGAGDLGPVAPAPVEIRRDEPQALGPLPGLDEAAKPDRDVERGEQPVLRHVARAPERPAHVLMVDDVVDHALGRFDHLGDAL